MPLQQHSNRGFFAGSTLRQPPPERSLPQCGACGLYELCESPKMPVSGGGKRKILFVAEAPGKDEDEQGTQLVGQSGKFLRRVLRGFDFDLDRDGWKTNALICRPPKNRKPRPQEIGFCRPNVMRTIRELKPNVIVLLGGSAVDSVLGTIWGEDTGGINRWVGWDIPCHALNAWVCPTWHPAYLLREEDPVLENQFKAHLSWAVAHTRRPWLNKPPNLAADVRKVFDPDEAARWLRKCATQQRGAIAWDYETDRLKPDGDDARIVSCAVAWGREGPEKCIAYPWHGEAIKATGELLRSPIPKIASNLKFEDRWTRRAFGHRVRNWVWDTMLAAHVADNRPAITSVKFQGFVRYGVPVWNDKVEPFLKTKGSSAVNKILEQIDINDLLEYNGLDALIEFKVAVHQMQELGYKKPWRP